MRIEAVNRLRLRDVLVLRVSEPEDPEAIEASVSEFAQSLQSLVKVPILLIDSSMSLESLDEEQMRQAGWERIRSRPVPAPVAPAPVAQSPIAQSPAASEGGG